MIILSVVYRDFIAQEWCDMISKQHTFVLELFIHSLILYQQETVNNVDNELIIY